jgi:hypothetical protein
VRCLARRYVCVSGGSLTRCTVKEHSSVPGEVVAACTFSSLFAAVVQLPAPRARRWLHAMALVAFPRTLSATLSAAYLARLPGAGVRWP